MHTGLTDLLIFAAAAAICVPLFRKFNLGAILAYLFSGIIIGPDVLSLIDDPKVMLHFSELGVVFLLFIIGLELAPIKLWNLRKAIFGLGLLQLLVTGGAFTTLGVLFNFGLTQSFIAGFALALSSTAFSIQILDENRQLNTAYGQGAFSILMLQDLAVVPLLAMLTFLANSATDSFTLFTIGRAVLVISAIIGLGPFLLRPLLRTIANSRTQEVFTAMSLFIVIGTALLMESIGLSMGMGAFLAGVLLANSEYRHELEVNLMPFKGLLLGLFFIAVGMSLSLDVIQDKPAHVLTITAVLLFVKIIIIYFLALLFKFPKESARNMAFLLPQGGEFAFVLFTTAFENGLMNGEQTSTLNAAVTISMALTPLLFYLNKRFLKISSDISERPYDNLEDTDAEVIIAGFGRFGQIVARFLKAQKIRYIILEHNASQVEAARKFGNKVYYGDASRQDILESAGAKRVKLFVLAIDDVSSSVATAKMIKEHFPHIEIIARVRNRQHAIELMELGINNVHRETYLTSLEVAKNVLIKKGHKLEDINQRLKKFRIHDELILKNQYEYRNDEEKSVSYTIQANKELEDILIADMNSQK